MSLNGPAAARLYDEHVDAIYAYAARRVGPAAAVSVVEEVFEQALRKNAERPPHTTSDLGWLFAMATAFLRRHSEAECQRLKDWQPVVRDTSRAIPRVSDPLLTNDAEDPTVTTTTRVMAAIADLYPIERDVLFLVAWEGCSSSLTATATGLPQSEIRPTLARIRKTIRRIVSEGNRTSSPEASTPTPGPTTTVSPDDADQAPGPVTGEATVDAVTEPDAADALADPDATEPLDRSDDPLAAFLPSDEEEPS